MRTPKKKETNTKRRKISSLKQLETIGNVTEITINYRNKVKLTKAPQVCCSYDAYQILKKAWSDRIEHIEEFVILLLNRANKVLGLVKISQGGMSETVADSRIIFQAALVASASGIILSHNHPSGNLKPSLNDLQLTNKLKKIGYQMDLPILDHLIITPVSYFSFADEGLL
ncbi:MAG: JAB domain-containing protein [Flavobacteriales bacterium]|nr:JAB domain-containing protein [Flavobacteriales bacterium]